MAFDPPGPQSNPTTGDFLWGQEVVSATTDRDLTRGQVVAGGGIGTH